MKDGYKGFKVGDRVIIEDMDLTGEPNPFDTVLRYIGKEGVIERIDDAGQLHGTWGSLALDPTVDEIRKVE